MLLFTVNHLISYLSSLDFLSLERYVLQQKYVLNLNILLFSLK